MIMPRRFALLLLLAAGPAIGQTAPDAPPPVSQPEAPQPAPAVPTPPPVAPPRTDVVKVLLTTSVGPMTLELEKVRAPVTTANFLRYVDQKRLDGTVFYRALKFPSDTPLGLVQFGTRNAPKRVLPPIAHESTAKTGLVHDNGAISMARGAPGTAAGDFFIILGGLASLNANPQGTGDAAGYAVFGHVVEGIENAVKVLEAPTSPTAGEGAMKGQMLEKPITVISARRLK